MTNAQLKAIATGQVQRPQRTILDYLDDSRVKTGIAAVAGKFLTADRMLRLCVNAVKKTPLLMQCDPQTVLGAMMTAAALGLEPNTIQQQAFLIPYRKRVKQGNTWIDTYECQFQIGARGFVTLAHRSPHIKSLVAEAIHEGDFFDHQLGSETFLKYKKSLKTRGPLIGSFSHVHLTEGFESACVLPLEELHKIRAKSETFRALSGYAHNASDDKERAKAELKLAETPWVMWEDDMASKSAIKKHAKQLPIASGDNLLAAADIDNRGEMSTLDLKTMADPDAVRAVMNDGMDVPSLENSPSDTIEMHIEGGEIEERQVASTSAAKPATQKPAQQRQVDDRDQDPFGDAKGKSTYAQVVDKLNRAKTSESFDLARSLIAEVADEKHRAELNAIATQRYAAIKGEL